jgi:hypothetical protein
MRKLVKYALSGFLVLSSLMSVFGAEVSPFGNATDNGFIVSLEDFNVTIQGDLGLHVFELVGPCTWCEEGVGVQITFLSVSRARMRDIESPSPKAPVNLLIIRDGREETLN